MMERRNLTVNVKHVVLKGVLKEVSDFEEWTSFQKFAFISNSFQYVENTIESQ